MSNRKTIQLPNINEVKPVGFDISIVNPEKLSPSQKALFEYFEGSLAENSFLKRKDLNPSDIPKLLPNIILLDIIRGAQGQYLDLKVRLEGTNIVNFYGEATGELMENEDENSFKNKFPEAYNRMVEIVGFVLDKKRPVISHAEQVSKDLTYLQVNNLTFPFSENSKDIDMILMFIEILAHK